MKEPKTTIDPQLAADLKLIKEQIGRWVMRCPEKHVEFGTRCLLMEGHSEAHVWFEGEDD